MEMIKDNFEINKLENGTIIFSCTRKNNNIYQTPINFYRRVIVQNKENNYILRLNKVIFKKDKIIFRFCKNKYNLPEKLLDTKISYVTMPGQEKNKSLPKLNQNFTKIQEQRTIPISEHKPEPKIKQQTVRYPRIIRNPYIYTNVESGYSAKSFPNVYIARYKYGPQGNKFQTTPQVSPIP